jgi:hypothetical protein
VVDLHKDKASHMSLPLADDTEFHLNKKELPNADECEVGEKYTLCFEAECTSNDGDSVRFKAHGLPEVESYDDEETSPAKMSMSKLREKLQKGTN